MKIVSMRRVVGAALLILLASLLLAESSSPAAASVQPAKQAGGTPWYSKFQRSADNVSQAEEEEEEAAARKKEEQKKPLFGGKQKTKRVEPEKGKKEDTSKSITGLFGIGSGKDNKKDNNVEDEEDSPKSEKEPEKKESKPGIFGFGAKKAKPVDEKLEPDDNSKSIVKEEDDKPPSSNTTVSQDNANSSVNATKPQDDANKTTDTPPPPFPTSSALQQLRFPASKQQHHQSGIVIMGLDGRPQRLPPTPNGGRQPGQAPTSTAVLAEAVATIVSTGIRFWFLTSLTRWFADEEIKSLKKPTQHFVWERLNDRYLKDHEALETALRAAPFNVGDRKWRRHLSRQSRQEQRLARRKNNKNSNATNTTATDAKNSRHSLTDTFQRTVVVVELARKDKGDVDLQHLEEVVTFLLTEHRRKAFGVELEVIILMESPGGGVSDYGLAAAQMQRLTAEEGIVTTVCVDKVGASGGYMIASQANTILAAPFAVVGSIGVIREGLNFNKALEKYGIVPLVLTAGEAKAPLSTYGEVTKRGVDIAKRQLEKTHEAFRELVVRGRPVLADVIDEVADGDIFLGQEAKDLKLVDNIMTSEEYILDRVQAGDRVLKLHRMPQFLKNRRFPNIHPLDFLKENGQQWLMQQDIPKLVSRVLQTTSFLKFFKYFIEKNGMC